ncbi:hypothetical protein MNBD_GAMMA07-351 [hydrothermal vent metagenome]|uniref:Globin domain-containing protein n=1 Tax=hydrothermal vent metagenome TaxID=652676 RepID=A0A3B0WPH8_9ZZZZ
MATTITVLGKSVDETALLKGYELISKTLNAVVVDFYDELFSQYPDIKLLFKNINESTQADKLASALKLLIENLHDEILLNSVLSDMGERHQQYGALPEHYTIVAELLLLSFKKNIGRSWTKAINTAWLNLLVGAAQIMCAAYKEGNSIVEESAVTPVLILNSIQDISKSQSLKDEMLTLFDSASEIYINASAVERIDGSAMQLMCALFIYAQKNDYIINWVAPSEALMSSVKTLGMQNILQLG